MSLMTRCLSSLALVMAGALTLPASAQVGVPDAFGLQGFIHTQSGASFDGTASLEVRIYDAETGGTMLYTETIADVDVAGSRFAVIVGAGGTFPTTAYTTVTELFSQLPEVYVAVAIDGNAELPRQRMVTAAFAFRSAVADGAWSLLCADCVGTSHLQDSSVTAAKLGIVCADGEVLKNTAGVWGCAADDNTTDVTPGDGIDYTAGVISIASTNCATGEVLKRNAANDGWECAPDAGAQGSVTSLSAGEGIAVTGPSGDVTVSVVPPTDATLGGVLASACPAGEYVAGYDITGAPVCVADTDTNDVYTAAAGGGLEINSNEIGIAADGITGAMIADGSIDAGDLAPSVLSAVQGELQLNFNAGFESGTEDWLTTATEPNTNAPQLDADTPDGSANALLLDSSTTVDAASLASTKTYPIKPGSQITLQAWVQHVGVFPNGGYGSRVVATFFNAGGDPLSTMELATDDSDLAWEMKTTTTVAPAGAVAVGITDVSIDPLTIGAARYDNVQIYATSPDLAEYMPNAFPSGSVMFFDRQACPPGWSVMTDAVGRSVVGMDGAGTLKGIRGTALSDLENRAHSHNVNPPSTTSSSVANHVHSVNPPNTTSTTAGAHTHTVDPAAVTSTSNGAHTHTVDPAAVTSTSNGAHTHTVNPPATNTDTDTHNHMWMEYDGPNKEWWTFDASTVTDSQADFGRFLMMDWGDGMDNAGGGHYPISRNTGDSDFYYTDDDAHNHSVDIASFNSGSNGSHTHSVNVGSTTSSSNGAHTHSVDVGSTTSSSNGNHTHATNIAAFNSAGAGGHSHTLDVPAFDSGTVNTGAVMPYVQLLVCKKD